MLELLMSRRSIRKFEKKGIEKEKVDNIIKGALSAPSSKGKRSWELIAVEDREVLLELSKCRGKSSSFIGDCALAVVVVGNPDISDVWVEDAAILSVIIQIVAHSEGLGSCWVQVRNRLNPEDEPVELRVKDLLMIPKEYFVDSIIAIGYPAEEKKAYEESELPYSKVHRNKW